MLPSDRFINVKKFNKATPKNPLSGNKNLYRLKWSVLNHH